LSSVFFLLFAWVWQSFLVSDPDTGWWPCLVPDLDTSLPMFLNPDTGLTWPRSKTLGFGMTVKFRSEFTKIAKARVWHDPKLKFLGYGMTIRPKTLVSGVVVKSKTLKYKELKILCIFFIFFNIFKKILTHYPKWWPIY
jgi:hypothetical protein